MSGVMTHAYNTVTCEVKAEGLGIQAHHQL